jgi:hypothetical protein
VSGIKGDKDLEDVSNLLALLGITQADEAIAVMLAYFPQTARDHGRERFVVDWLLKNPRSVDVPSYPLPGDTPPA